MTDAADGDGGPDAGSAAGDDHDEHDGKREDDHDEHDGKRDDGHDEHDHHHHDVESVGAAVVTVTSTRTMETDSAGDVIVDAFEAAGHEVVQRELIPDEFDRVQSVVDNLASREDVRVVVTTGGTGVTPDDVTVEAARELFDKRLPGFGELFRRLSYEEVGTRVVGTRAVGGVADGALVFCLPGSESAARLGSEEILVPEVPHLAGLARRDDGT